MTNPYFDINLPSNNKISDYDSWSRVSQEILNKLQPKDLHKIIYLAFCTKGNNPNYILTLKKFIKEYLKDKKNHEYLCVRFKEKNRPANDNCRNNVIHSLLWSYSENASVEDINLFKYIISSAIEAGVHPLEKSTVEGLSTLGMFMQRNSLYHRLNVEMPIDAQLDFLQFLIDLDPKSLVDLSIHNHCALSALSGYSQEITPVQVSRFQVVIKNLPPEALEVNLKWFEANFHMNRGRIYTNLFKPALDELRVRSEQLMLNDTIGSVIPQNDGKERILKI